jgi:hypothetical protein
MTAALIKQVLAAFKEQRDEIGDSDLYGEQPVTLRVSTTLGELRKVRSASYAASLPSAPAKTADEAFEEAADTAQNMTGECASDIANAIRAIKSTTTKD